MTDKKVQFKAFNERQYRSLVGRYYNLGHEVECSYRNRENKGWMPCDFRGNWGDMDYRLAGIVRKKIPIGNQEHYYHLTLPEL